MKRECIPILFKLNSRNPSHSFNLAPSISYSGGGAHIIQILGLCRGDKGFSVKGDLT